MLESLSNKVAGLKAGNFNKKRLQHRCFPVKIAKFLRTAFLYDTSGSCFCQFDNDNCSVLGICRPSLLNQKHNVRWLLLKRFADLVRACSLHIISRNHSSKILLINLENRNLPKVIVVWAICSDIRILTVQADFCPLLNVYFNDMQINMWIHLSSGL